MLMNQSCKFALIVVALLALPSGIGRDGIASAQGRRPSTSETARPPDPAGVTPPPDYLIGPEDVLDIVFWRDEDMTDQVTVRPDGMITLPLVGDLQAAGLKPQALRDVIHEAAATYFEDVNVTVIVRQINSRNAFITGLVRAPGAYPLTGPRTVLQLIALAGGLAEYADKGNITIMRVEEGQTRLLKFNYDHVAQGKNVRQNIQLKPGDTVIVP